ncbi:response regulator [Clostridium carnis]
MYSVLHIEQSSFFSKLVKRIVEEKGYKYIQVETFNEANEVLSEENVDLIITALYSKDGVIEEFVKDINEKFNIPIFIVTSDNVDDKRKELINLGISEYILKNDLENEIKKHIDTIFREDEYMKALKNANIAVVEDNAFATLIEKEILTKYGIDQVDYFKSGKALINSEKKYDIYLIDIILKNEFGKDIIRKVRRDNIDASIIAVTSLDNNKTLAKILDSGADDFIIKPVDEDIFIAKLKSHIRVCMLQKEIKSLKGK